MKFTTVEPFLVIVLLINFFLLGSGRLRSVIHAVALQGAILGIVYLLAHVGTHDSGATVISVRSLVLAAAMIAIKGLVVPKLMMYAMREARVEWRIEPYVGFTASMLLGAIGTGLVMALSATLPLRAAHDSDLLVSSSLASVLTGFLILTTRREALCQVVGYIVLENGIFIFGLLLLEAMPFMVEIGVLLDLFVGVFVMGIIIHHVHRQFEASTSDHLSTLKE